MTLLLKSLPTYLGAYHPGAGPFLLANLFVLAAAAATEGYQTWKIARVNLAETLKNSD
jgi:hypothetical protein